MSISVNAFRIAAAVLLCAPFLVSTAAAQTTRSMNGLKLSNDEPIQIESDQLEIKDAESKATFNGNVKVVQGTTTLQAGSMTVFYKSGAGNVSSGDADIDRIEVTEKVFLSSGTQQATADTGTFDMTNETLVLKGQRVVLSEGKNVFVGCQLNVTMSTGEARLEACNNGRVQIQLDPKSRKQN